MSSKYVRDEFKTFLTANSVENQVDLTAQYLDLNQVLTDHGLARNDDWLGLQFIASNEEITSLYADNNNGCYREIGAVILHIVSRAKATIADDLINRSETLRNLLRGQRINDIVIESVTPPNFESGATLQLDAGYQSAAVIVNYYRDLNL